ncbi:hypothetical protein D6D29_10702, partial [Aureobasidium pullulans]
SFGSVYKAQHYSRFGVFAGHFAIKVFLEEDRESGEREMEVISKLTQCKNIVRFEKAIPYTGPDKLFIFSMELMDCDLDRYLREHGPLSSSDIRAFGGQLFEALRCLHERGLVHRDLKPANILISTDWKRLKIGDLGSIARLRRTEKRLEYCTLNYRAPEHLFRSETWTFKVDMWSAGCVVAEVMRPPQLGPLFQGRTKADVRDAIIELLELQEPSEPYQRKFPLQAPRRELRVPAPLLPTSVARRFELAFLRSIAQQASSRATKARRLLRASSRPRIRRQNGPTHRFSALSKTFASTAVAPFVNLNTPITRASWPPQRALLRAQLAQLRAQLAVRDRQLDRLKLQLQLRISSRSSSRRSELSSRSSSPSPPRLKAVALRALMFSLLKWLAAPPPVALAGSCS